VLTGYIANFSQYWHHRMHWLLLLLKRKVGLHAFSHEFGNVPNPWTSPTFKHWVTIMMNLNICKDLFLFWLCSIGLFWHKILPSLGCYSSTSDLSNVIIVPLFMLHNQWPSYVLVASLFDIFVNPQQLLFLLLIFLFIFNNSCYSSWSFCLSSIAPTTPPNSHVHP
jgi:hypothetical protein